MTRAARSTRLVLVAVALLVGVGCQVDARVDIVVHDDGSGTVAVAVGLDAEALARVPDLAEQLRTDDLEAAGWSVEGPVVDGDRTWVTATKPFGDPTRLAAVLDEITGPGGMFRDVRLERRKEFAAVTYELAGTVDLSGGLELFSDDELAAALDGDPFGGNLQILEEELGRPATEMVSFTVTAEVPGAEPAVWRPSFADPAPTEMALVGQVTDDTPKIWIGLAVVAFAAAALIPVRAAFRRRGPDRRPPPRTVPLPGSLADVAAPAAPDPSEQP